MTFTAPIQRQFDFTDLDRACLALVSTVKCLVSCDEFKVFQLIRDHELVAFDLSGPGTKKVFPGIWFQSIRAYLQRRAGGCRVPLRYNGEATALAIAELLSVHREKLRLTELTMSLCVTRRHIHNLLEAHLLTAVPGTGDRISRAPLIWRASVVEFLTGRRM
jgi:hypothetical protein